MRFRKKPVVIEAVQWTGTVDSMNEISSFVPTNVLTNNGVRNERDPEYAELVKYNRVSIETLEGVMRVNLGDYIIKGITGEFYPCKPDIFAKTYEKVEENPNEIK